MADFDTSELRVGVEALSKEVAREAANRWHSGYIEKLLAAGDEHDYDVFPLAQATLPPEWDEGNGGYRFGNPHEAANCFEDGTAPHEITPSQADVLAFEWPDAPPEIREMFEDSWPTVFFPKVEVEGIERTDAFKNSQRDAVRWVDQQEG